MELIENQLGKGALAKSTQSQIPPPLPKSPPSAPHQPQPIRPEHDDPKRKRKQRGKDVVEVGRACPTREDEAQRAAK